MVPHFYIIFFIFLIDGALFAHGLPNRSNDPFSETDLAHGYHIHAPFEYALGEGMHYGLHKEFGGHFEIAFAPIFSLDGDKYSRLINLKQYGHRDIHRHEHKTEIGYIYKQNKSITVALGLDFHLAFGMPVTSFSLMPQTSKFTYVERRIDKKKDIKYLSKKLIIPSNQKELSQWRVGDRLFFKKNASITFMIDGGLEPFLYTGPVFNVMGDWVVGFEKISKNKMRFSVTKSKIYSFGYEFDGLFFALGIENFRGRDRLFQFDLDLSSNQAKNVLLDLMKGKLESAQKASEERCSGIVQIEKGLAKYKGIANFQIFILPFLWGASHLESKSSASELGLETTDASKQVSSLILDKKNTAGILSKHKLKMSLSFTNLDISNEKNRSFAGTYSWVFEKEGIDDDDINKRLVDLGKRIGLRPQLNFDKLSHKHGYAKIQFLNKFSMAAIVQLVNTANDLTKSLWLVHFENAVRNNFDQHRYHKGFDNSAKSYANFVEEGEKLLDRTLDHLKHAKSYMQAEKYKKFTMEVAKAIKLIHSDPNIFLCFMRQIEGFQMFLALEGENVLMQTKKLLIP
ncbi:MAG: hypothetical protein AB8G05_15955 [Oligoflexales bacterium]